MSGWTTATIEANNHEDAVLLADELEGYETNEHAEVNDDVVRALFWGYSNDALVAIKDTAERWSRAVLMDCNDTSDSGNGAAYESDGRSVEKLDSASGVEAARGHDARAELEEYVDAHIYMR